MRASLDMRANIAARGPANNQVATKCGFARTKSGYVRLNGSSLLKNPFVFRIDYMAAGFVLWGTLDRSGGLLFRGAGCPY